MEKDLLGEIAFQTNDVVKEVLEQAQLREKEIIVIGCTSSEVSGHRIGTFSSVEIAGVIYESIAPYIKEKHLFLAAQCCEHLNRALIVEREMMEYYHLEQYQVNVRPQPKAGGSFATKVFEEMKEPVALEYLQAHAGIDIGGTLIGMHLRPVAVPLKIAVRQIGFANITAAKTRLKYIGGSRANYVE